MGGIGRIQATIGGQAAVDKNAWKRAVTLT
jgi:hypothetical protein